MAKRLNTGKYRICKNQNGVNGSIAILKEGNEMAIAEAWRTMEKPLDFIYYVEEEVFYQDTLLDADGNPSDSAPAWVRKHDNFNI